jgi:hypothetical protein
VLDISINESSSVEESSLLSSSSSFSPKFSNFVVDLSLISTTSTGADEETE